jgi:hypothetical protein
MLCVRPPGHNKPVVDTGRAQGFAFSLYTILKCLINLFIFTHCYTYLIGLLVLFAIPHRYRRLEGARQR